MMDINRIISDLRKTYVPAYQDRITRLFKSSSQSERGQLAYDMLTQLPFDIMADFHSAALDRFCQGRDGFARLREDQKGHIGMSGEAVLSFYDEKSPKTAEERYEYFRGISIVFPYILLGNHHGWVFEGVPNAPDYQKFMDANVILSQEKYEPMLRSAYEKGDEALSDCYCRLAAEHPFTLLEKYCDWLVNAL